MIAPVSKSSEPNSVLTPLTPAYASKNDTIEDYAAADNSQRLQILDLIGTVSQNSIEEEQEVIAGLSSQPKHLPPKYFYDDRGSQLFEQICQLPEYYPTRTEVSILKENAGAITQITNHLTNQCEIVELGSGSATKARILLDAYQATGHALRYIPIDVSKAALIESAQALLAEYPALSIQALAGTYERALENLPSPQFPQKLLCFLGSTIGNLSPTECSAFLNNIQAVLQPGDYFLLGLDLQKESSILEKAYNDSKGVTAKFNLNMLSHLNKKWEGNFNLDHFAHVAYYDPQQSQIEMHIESLKAQTVHLKKIAFSAHFAQGERLRSEISRKFNLKDMAQLLKAHQLPVLKTFTDSNDWFGLLLCQRRL